MQHLRDDTAERLVIVHRKSKRLRAAVESGQYTRLELAQELNRIIEESLRGILNMTKAGASVSINALDEIL